MQQRLGISRRTDIPEKLLSIRNAMVAFQFVEGLLQHKCYRTEKTVRALIALDEARIQALTQIKFDHVEEGVSET